MTDRLEKVAKALPMNNLILSQCVQAELRWERTKGWRSNSTLKESELIELQVENVGKIIIQCEYIQDREIESHLLQDKQEQSSINEAGLRRDSINKSTARPNLFKIPGFSALSGAFVSSPRE